MPKKKKWSEKKMKKKNWPILNSGAEPFKKRVLTCLEVDFFSKFFFVTGHRRGGPKMTLQNPDAQNKIKFGPIFFLANFE